MDDVNAYVKRAMMSTRDWWRPKKAHTSNRAGETGNQSIGLDAKSVRKRENSHGALVVRRAIFHKPKRSDVTYDPNMNSLVGGGDTEVFASIVVQIIFSPCRISR